VDRDVPDVDRWTITRSAAGSAECHPVVVQVVDRGTEINRQNKSRKNGAPFVSAAFSTGTWTGIGRAEKKSALQIRCSSMDDAAFAPGTLTGRPLT